MARRQDTPLRPLTADERAQLEPVARAGSERADRVARAKILLAVADGAPFTVAGRVARRLSGVAVRYLVARFNTAGLTALQPRHRGGPPRRYGPAERERILCAFHRPTGRRTVPPPDR